MRVKNSLIAIRRLGFSPINKFGKTTIKCPIWLVAKIGPRLSDIGAAAQRFVGGVLAGIFLEPVLSTWDQFLKHEREVSHRDFVVRVANIVGLARPPTS